MQLAWRRPLEEVVGQISSAVAVAVLGFAPRTCAHDELGVEVPLGQGEPGDEIWGAEVVWEGHFPLPQEVGGI